MHKIILFLLLSGAGMSQAVGQQPDLQDINTVKALFVYNFTKYIEWPNMKPGAPFVIQVHGDEVMKDRLETMLKGRKVNDHPIVVRLYSANDSSSVQINYIPAKYFDRTKTAHNYKIYSGSLCITDGITARNINGINLVKIDDKLRFQLNEQALKKEGLKVSTQLIELAFIPEEQ